MYQALVGQMCKHLVQLEHWLDATVAYAESKKIDADRFLDFRLAPDQFALARQIQITCDTAKLGASRICGKDAPVHADTEKTIAEIKTRVEDVRAYLAHFGAVDYDGAALRVITQPRWEGKTMTGADYFLEHVTPNFFFHLSHTYAILRHNGVPLGKRDFLGPLTMHAPA
ncbi:MAG: DUF1993 domain-containing protein [Deltaproteobacteria bacterium]|nr:DUF1993 domain-containing protein [Deltaproteobacteria bacterium]